MSIHETPVAPAAAPSVNIQDQIAFFTKAIQDAVAIDQLEDAIAIMRPFLEPIDDDLAEESIHFAARLNQLKRERREGTLTTEEYNVGRAKLRVHMLDFVNDLPEKVRVKQQLQALMSRGMQEPPAPAPVSLSLPAGVEEKILGNKNDMRSIVWLAKALLAAKSVCRVLVGGRPEGTGFLLKGGYLMTNAHVLPNDAVLQKTTIEFNFEDGQTKTTRYKVEPVAVRRSPSTALDYCLVKVVDDPARPLKKWGHLELETEVEVRKDDPVNIIQHPNGGSKQLTFRSNDVISVWDDKIFYIADTDNGSSGSPVFNDDWKVVALHSRGISEKEGGMQINAEGEKAPANQGFAIIAIATELQHLL